MFFFCVRPSERVKSTRWYTRTLRTAPLFCSLFLPFCVLKFLIRPHFVGHPQKISSSDRTDKIVATLNTPRTNPSCTFDRSTGEKTPNSHSQMNMFGIFMRIKIPRIAFVGGLESSLFSRSHHFQHIAFEQLFKSNHS